MKAYREAADKAMSAKLKRLGAKGDKKFAMKGEKKGYATGGGIPMDDMGSDIGGGAPKPNLSKPPRAGMGGKGKKPGGKGAGKGKTNVNVIVMGGHGGPPGGAMGPGGTPDMLPPGGMKPPGPPMMPPGGGPGGPGGPPMLPKPPMPPGGGGPPMPPMRARGGRVNKMPGAVKPIGKGKRGC